MDNERDALERELVKEIIKAPFDLMSPDDKQWYIEIETLKQQKMAAQALIDQALSDKINAEASKLYAEAAIIEANARLQEALNEKDKLEITKPIAKGTVNVSCCCGCSLEYEGDGADEALAEFQDKHYNCY